MKTFINVWEFFIMKTTFLYFLGMLENPAPQVVGELIINEISTIYECVEKKPDNYRL